MSRHDTPDLMMPAFTNRKQCCSEDMFCPCEPRVVLTFSEYEAMSKRIADLEDDVERRKNYQNKANKKFLESMTDEERKQYRKRTYQRYKARKQAKSQNTENSQKLADIIPRSSDE